MNDYFSFDNIDDWVFYRIIVAKEKTTRKNIFWKRWNLPYSMVVKWDWYFKYRAALIQVQNPRAEVIVYMGKELKMPVDLEKNKRNKVRACKAKITEMKNKLQRAYDKAAETELFGIDDHPHVVNWKSRLVKKEAELLKYQETDVTEYYNTNKDRDKNHAS